MDPIAASSKAYQERKRKKWKIGVPMICLIMVGLTIVGLGAHTYFTKDRAERVEELVEEWEVEILQEELIVTLNERVSVLSALVKIDAYLLDSLTDVFNAHLAEENGDYTAEEVSRLLVYQDDVMTDLGLKVEDLETRLGRLETKK